MGMTVWGSSQIADYITGNSSIPATLYLALTSGEPSDFDTGSDINEPLDGAYARQAISTGVSWSAGESGTTLYLNAVEFGPATANWDNITHWAICTAATDGNLLIWGPWDQEMAVYAGQKLVVPEEGIGFSIATLVGSSL